jgi:hypothetical protein
VATSVELYRHGAYTLTAAVRPRRPAMQSGVTIVDRLFGSPVDRRAVGLSPATTAREPSEASRMRKECHSSSAASRRPGGVGADPGEGGGKPHELLAHLADVFCQLVQHEQHVGHKPGDA